MTRTRSRSHPLIHLAIIDIACHEDVPSQYQIDVMAFRKEQKAIEYIIQRVLEAWEERQNIDTTVLCEDIDCLVCVHRYIGVCKNLFVTPKITTLEQLREFLDSNSNTDPDRTQYRWKIEKQCLM